MEQDRGPEQNGQRGRDHNGRDSGAAPSLREGERRAQSFYR